jgi:hypothetical protein
MTEHMKWLQKIIEQYDETDYLHKPICMQSLNIYILEYSELIRAQKIRIPYLSGCLVGL